jgi:hypothetical protein
MARTTKQRSIAAKKAWKKRNEAAAVKVRNAAADTDYESKQFTVTPMQIDTTTPYEKFVKGADAAEEQLRLSVFHTTKEETRQDLEMALYHMRIVNRYAKKAYTL